MYNVNNGDKCFYWARTSKVEKVFGDDMSSQFWITKQGDTPVRIEPAANVNLRIGLYGDI